MSTKKHIALSILIIVLTSSFALPNTSYAVTVTVCHPTGGGYSGHSVDVDLWNADKGHAGHDRDFISTDGTCILSGSDTTAPTATIEYSVAGPYKSGTTVRITAIWNENMKTGIGVTTITITDPANQSSTYNMIPIISGGGTTRFYYDHLVGSGDGTFSIIASGKDASGNSGNSNNSNFTVDNTAPTTSANVLTGSYNSDQTVTLTANEAATIYFTTNGANPTTSSTQYSGAITISSTTTLKYFARDTAGNSESVKTQTYTIDKIAPTVTLTTTSPNPTRAPIIVTATFSESVTGLTIGEIVTNGTASGLSGSGTTYTFTVTSTVTGTISTRIPANTAQDSVTNNNVDSNTLLIRYDNTVTTVPDAPTGLTVTGSDRRASLSWTAPTNNGGSALIDYVLRICQNNCNVDASWSIVTDPELNSTSADITSLTNGQQYTFKVNAVNAIGRSSNSTSQTRVIGEVPSTPGMKIIPGNGQAKIQFNVPTGEINWSGVKILKFNHLSNNFETLYDMNNDRISITSNGGAFREVVITGLTNNVKYSLKVIPINTVGNGSRTTDVVIIPTSSASALSSSDDLKFYSPPQVTSSNLEKLRTFGLSDSTVPSPALITANQLNPFDGGINQKIILDTTITKDTSMNTVLRTYGIPTYEAPSDWATNNVFTVPPIIIPVTSGGLTVGQQSVYSVASVSPQKPILLALNDANKISSINGKIAGVSFTLNATARADKFNMTSTYTTAPPAGVTEVSGALMYMDFNTAVTTGVNFGKSTSFDSAPSVSFTLGPQSGSTSSSNPTNTVNSAITCPQPVVSHIADDGTTSATGIIISRNTSGDDSTSCGYTATLQHFSSYAVTVSTSSSSSSSTGSGSSKAKPELVNDPYILRIANSKYKISELSSLSSAVFPVGVPVEIEILLKDSGGPENISHVELFLNKHNDKILNDLSETTIIYDRFNGNGLLDRNYLVGSYTIIPTVKNDNASIIFKIIFKNQMQKSDLVFRIWNLQRNGLNLHVSNALEIVSSSQQIELCHIPPQVNQKQETISIPKSELQIHLSHGDTTGKCLEKSSLKEWVRYYVELWQFGIIDDQTFKEGFNHLIDQGIIEIDQNENELQSTITSDFKKNAMNWYQKNITDNEFLSLLKKPVR